MGTPTKGYQPQERRGYPHTSQGNPNKPEPHRPEPNKDPSIADSDPAGNKITTNYPMKQSSNKEEKTRGSDIPPQSLRGYVHNAPGHSPSTVSGNARRGSPPTIQKISGPDMTTGPTSSQVAADKAMRGTSGEGRD